MEQGGISHPPALGVDVDRLMDLWLARSASWCDILVSSAGEPQGHGPGRFPGSFKGRRKELGKELVSWAHHRNGGSSLRAGFPEWQAKGVRLCPGDSAVVVPEPVQGG